MLNLTEGYSLKTILASSWKVQFLYQNLQNIEIFKNV